VLKYGTSAGSTGVQDRPRLSYLSKSSVVLQHTGLVARMGTIPIVDQSWTHFFQPTFSEIDLPGS
jgi:hypothetical protein